MAINDWWKAKKSNNGKRVNMYSHPGVSEVIIRGEWKRPRRYSSYSIKEPWSVGDVIFLIIVIGILVGIIKLFIW